MKKLIPLLLVFALAACNPVVELEATETTAPTIEVPTEMPIEAGAEPTCVANPAPPTPSEEDLAVFTPDPDRDWIKGPEDALITIIEYADFECPYCSVASVNLRALREKYPDDVRVVYRHFPLASIHDKAIPAARAAEAWA